MERIRIRFSTRLAIGFIYIILSLIGLVWVGVYSINHIADSKRELDRTLYISKELAQIRAEANRLNSLFLEAILAESESERNAMFSTINQHIARIQNSAEKITIEIEGDQEMIDYFDIISSVLITARENRAEQLEILSRGGESEMVYQNYKEVQTSIYNGLIALILDLEDVLDSRSDNQIKSTDELVKNSSVTLILTGVVILLIIAGISFGTFRLVTRISKDIREGVLVLSTSSSEIQTTMAEISTGATETTTAISETSTTMEEIRQTAILAREKAKELMERSKKAAEVSEQGLESSEKMITSMKQIEKQMKLINETINKLAEQNRSIGEITSTVADIADQSNLLAVNAAIEAAKAGEHGRGFSVVAHEIRSLAEQSKKSTVQVKEILNEIQRSVNHAVDVIKQGTETVDVGIELVNDDRAVVELLSENVDETMQASVQISSSSHQQMAGMDQIVPAMENIKQASEQNVQGIKQTIDAVRDLNELGKNLKSVIEKFRL